MIAGAVPNALNQAVVRSDNATKNVIHTGGRNRIVMEDTEGKQYVHIATPHKGSYIHIGSTFNPQYNKVTFTKGTSLSATDDISTSVVHTDAQTVVDDARITIIGRSRIHASDTPGVEIANLVASDFINRFDEGDVLYRTIATDAARVFVAGTNPTLDTRSSGLAFVAVGLALSDANAITSPTLASPGDQTTMQNDMAALQVAINQALTDLATLSSDASAFSTASGGSSAHPTANVTDSTSAIASAWKANVASAVAAMTNLQWAADAANNLLTAAVSAPPPLNLSAFVGAINAMSNAATGWRGTVNTAVTMVPTLPMSAPDCPNPSVTASYINLPHLDVNGNNQMGPSDGQPIDTSTANPVTLSGARHDGTRHAGPERVPVFQLPSPGVHAAEPRAAPRGVPRAGHAVAPELRIRREARRRR